MFWQNPLPASLSRAWPASMQWRFIPPLLCYKWFRTEVDEGRWFWLAWQSSSCRCFLHSAYALRINRNIHCRHVHLFCIYGTSGTTARLEWMASGHGAARGVGSQEASLESLSQWYIHLTEHHCIFAAHMARGIKLFNWWWLLGHNM